MIVSASGQSEMSNLKTAVIGAKAGVELGLYFTKGDSVTLGSETYLIAYRPQTRINPEVFQQHGHGADDTPPRPLKLRPNEKLALSLLNLRSTTSMNDIRPFNPEQDVETPQESNAASARNLQRLGQGMLIWLQSRGRGTLPEMGNRVTPRLKRTFYPFVHDQRLVGAPRQPKNLYRPNPILVAQERQSNRQCAVPAAFFEASPGPDGTRGVLFPRRPRRAVVSADRWERLQRGQDHPAPCCEAGECRRMDRACCCSVS
jgi:hypothetical protein